jgi:hypothetical protein
VSPVPPGLIQRSLLAGSLSFFHCALVDYNKIVDWVSVVDYLHLKSDHIPQTVEVNTFIKHGPTLSYSSNTHQRYYSPEFTSFLKQLVYTSLVFYFISQSLLNSIIFLKLKL